MIGIWRAALLCFLIAGATGALYRFGMMFGLPFGLAMGNVRHAHSHLMYFGWTIPALFALLMARLRVEERRPRVRAGRAIALAGLALGLSVYPPFLVAGYQPIAVFGRAIPVASMLSGLNMIVWYAFGVWYLTRTRGVRRTEGLRLWDGAILFLWLSTVGAWGRMVLEVTHAGAPILAEAAVHFFLGSFSEGWLVMAVLGLAHGREESPAAEMRGTWADGGVIGGRNWAYPLLLIGLPGAAFLGSGVEALPGWGLLVRLGGVLAAVGLLGYVTGVGRRVWMEGRWEWAFFLAFLLIKALMQVGIAIPAVAAWGEGLGLRIFYLHILTLGVVSTGLMAAAREAWGKAAAPSPWCFGGSVLLLLLGLVSLTPVWPLGGGGRAGLMLSAWTSLLPLAVIVGAVIPPRRTGMEVAVKRRGPHRV